MSKIYAPLAVLPLLALVLAAPTAHAQTVVFTDRTAFNAATSNLTTIDFNDQVPPGSTSTLYPTGTVTLSGVTFTTPDALFAVTPAYFFQYDLGDGTVLSFQGGIGLLNVALPTGTTAFGFDFGSFIASPFTFTLSSGDLYTFTGSATPTATPTFFGVTSTAPLSSLSITTAAGAPQIDRFSFNAAATAAVPEPSPYAAGGMLGASLLFGMVRAKRRTSSNKVPAVA